MAPGLAVLASDSSVGSAERIVAHLHTKFLFPFSIDVEEVKAANPEIWGNGQCWFEGLDELISAGPVRAGDDAVVRHFGSWQREFNGPFDLESRDYQNLVFFHPFIRRVFFDLKTEQPAVGEHSLLRSYRLDLPANARLLYHAEDLDRVFADVEVESIKLLLFANGIGILSLGVEAFGITVERALWINEMMRKVYASSGRQVREGRAPSRAALVSNQAGDRITIAEHDYSQGALVNLFPPLAKTVTSLLYFLDYEGEDYEPVLDERMVVYSYLCLDRDALSAGYSTSDEYQVLISRFLYVDRAGGDFRYDPQFTKEAMRSQLYTRWSHLGTYYGFTPYSSVAITIGSGGCNADGPREGLRIHRMFESRYYIMAMISLFYRASLLDYSERVALVSKRLYLDHWYGRLHQENIQLIGRLHAEFLHFNTHWYFDEPTNKDEECDHFRMQCLQYRTELMRRDIQRELDALNDSLRNYHQFRATEAVNRLAMISMILGCGAVVTGFFGMNFGHMFDFLLQPKPGSEWVYWVAISFPSIVAFGALTFGTWTIIANWSDYQNSLIPRRIPAGWTPAARLRKTSAREKRSRMAVSP